MESKPYESRDEPWVVLPRALTLTSQMTPTRIANLHGVQIPDFPPGVDPRIHLRRIKDADGNLVTEQMETVEEFRQRHYRSVATELSGPDDITWREVKESNMYLADKGTKNKQRIAAYLKDNSLSPDDIAAIIARRKGLVSTPAPVDA